MKNLKNTIAAVLVTAVLFSCGGNSSNENTANTDSTANTEIEAPGLDTMAITEGQSVDFGELTDGQKVKGPFTVRFKVLGMDVEPIDSGVRQNKGHFHLLIDTMNFIPAGVMVPMGSPKIIHYGKGQVESAKLELKPGPHKLSIQFADGMHNSYGIKMSKTITVNVIE